MKKVFISIPMNGRTDEAIKASMERMKKAVEATIGEDVEAIDSFLEGADYNDKPIACIGESIKRMQDADYFATFDRAWNFRGCSIERDIATAYNIPIIFVDVLSNSPEFADVRESLEKRETTCSDTRRPSTL